MFRTAISRAAFLTALLAVTPALADDSIIAQTLNNLSQQVQDQQKQINQLLNQLKQKQTAKTASQPKAQPQQEQYLDASEVAQTKPSVVAPLQPTSLGTLTSSDLVGNRTLGAVSQAQQVNAQPAIVSAPAAAQPQYAPSYAPQLPRQTVVAQQTAASVQPTAAPVSAPAATTTVASNRVSGAQAGYVGEAPPMSTKPPEVQALANVGGVLTPYGKIVIEPFLQYSRSSVNSFLFQGVEVVDSLLIGAVDANRTARDLVSGGATFRVGVSDRMELEARVPYVWRQDSLTNTIANTQNQTTTSVAQGYGLGDLEVAAHYQINDGHEDWPFFIGNLRFKSDTGSSPYKSEFNADGTAHTLATGSGFMAVEPSVTVIYPSDPATLFANLGYIHSIPETINGNVGNTFVGKVEPGDTYSASLGMGVALNDRLSFTLGYEHDYVRPTITQIAGASQQSQSLQVGSALSGISFRVNDRTSIALNLAAGVTKDAPDAVVSLRVPVTLQAF